MAELDYAFVADYARVEPGGKLTAVGASWTHVIVPAFPTNHLMAVAGRVRADENDPPCQLAVSLAAPNDSFKLTYNVELHRDLSVRPYAGRIGHLFAIMTGLPLLSEGLYEILIELDGAHARRLAFEVSLPPHVS